MVMRSLAIAVAWTTLAACNGNEPASVPDGGAAGAGGVDGASGSLSDFEVLGECAAAMPCQATIAQFAEATPHIDRDGFTCIMRALAARTPGLYRYENDSTNTFSSTGTDYVLLVAEDGSALYAAEGSYSSATAPMQSKSDRPSARCRLKPASYFESCVEALESWNAQPSSPAWACAYGELRSSWLEQCEDAPVAACQ